MTEAAATVADPRRWKALAVLGVAYLMVVLDISIVNVALPSIQSDLGFTTEDLQWVVSGYALTFGGFLLLGGRAGDLLGRRMVFMVGLGLFLVTSLLAGLSTSSEMLIIARLLQGAAGAILSPSVFSITLVTFAEGAERNKALGILGGIAGSGAAIGVLMGGVFTQYVSWEWIFFVNIPIAAIALALVPRYVRESKAEGLAKHFDAFGAVTVTGSLMLLVFALTQANRVGWASAQTIGVFAASAVLMAVFLWNETKSHSPLVPLSIFKRRTLTGANIIGFGLGTMIFGMFFLLSLYMQQVLGFSAMETGFGYLAVALTVIVAATISQGLVTKLGVKPVLVVGNGAADRRPRLLHPGVGRRVVRRRPAARLPDHRRRHGLLVRADLDRRARGRRRAGGRPRVRAHQHEPADRRRARPRSSDHGRHDPDLQPGGRRRAHGCRPHVGLQPGVLGRRGLRARLADHDDRRPSPEGHPGGHRRAGDRPGRLTVSQRGAAHTAAPLHLSRLSG